MSRERKPVEDVSRLPPGSRIHMIAICGVGMTAVAGMLKQRGYAVSGSDENVYPPMSTVLERFGIPIHQGFSAENLRERPDLVIVGNTVSRGNPEVAALLAGDLPFASFPQILGQLFLAHKRSVVIAGTHGKSTSTALMGWVLEQAGRDPSLMVGGESLDFSGNFKLGAGAEFVVEGDEYDTAFFDKGPKFLHYRARALLLTAVEFDHADIYRDLDHVKSAFRRLLGSLAAGTPVVVSADFPHAVDVARQEGGAFETFGLDSGADWRAVDLADTGSESRFRVVHGGRVEVEAFIRAPGAINVRNALGVYALGRHLGLEPDEILPGLRSFRGVARRQELVGELGGVTVIDDFAHHPTAVSGAIQAMRGRYGQRRLWAVFEPRSNTSRRKVFQREYVEALAAADRVIVGGVLQKKTDPVAAAEMFSPEQLVADLRRRGVAARSLADADEIAGVLASEAESGDVILLMSNGSFGGLRTKLAARLAAR